MPLNLFGFQINRSGQEQESASSSLQEFTEKPREDGAIPLEGGTFGSFIDIEAQMKNEVQLISRYRELAREPEAEKAVDDIINEAIVYEENDFPVSVVLDQTNFSKSIKDKINEEFQNILTMLQFNDKGYDIFRNWYVDGRLFYHMMIDKEKPKEGIQELRYIDPRKIKKVREKKKNIDHVKAGSIQTDIEKPNYNEYFLYSPKGLSSVQNRQGLKIAPDTIAFSHSGLMDVKNTTIQSHLHKAIKPMNQLRIMEDSTLIYHLSRAPERRLFSVECGSLPKHRAEQYVRQMMQKHKNKLVYNNQTGQLQDDKKFMTMTEDYWFPKREGRGTEVENLGGGQQLPDLLENVEMYRRKFYEALNVPTSRLDNEAQFNLGRASEISRDEIKFSRFIGRLRNKFSEIFHQILEIQLLLKGVITPEEWEENKGAIRYDFNEDNHFSELKHAEIMTERLNLLQEVEEYEGKYFSKAWIRKNVLQQSEDEIREMDKEIEGEAPEEDNSDQEEEKL